MLAVPFQPFCAFLGGLGLLCLAFVGAWCQRWRGGFAWDGGARMFNWHPVLMVAGMVVLYGAAALVYRLPAAWRGPKLPWKVLHGALALTAFGLTVVGLVAVFGFHNASKTPNMYSLHSWLGLATVLLFSCQEERDSNDAVQPPAPRGRLRQHAGAPHHPLRGAGAVRPGQPRLEAPRGRLHGHAPAPARHRALTPPRSVPAVPGLPARSSPTPLLSHLPRRLAFAGLPVPNALLLVGRTGSAALQQRCRCGGDVSLPPLWPSTGLLPASGQEQLQRRAPACVLVPLPASSCGVQLSPRAWTAICAKSAAPEPCGAISGTSSGWKPPEEHPVTGGGGTQHSVGCPSPVSSTGTAGALAPCLTLRGDVCVVVGPAQQPSGTPNKMLASAALLHLRPLGQPRPVLMFTLF